MFGLLRAMLLVALGAVLLAVVVVVASVGPGDVLAVIDATRSGDAGQLDDAILAARERATNRAKARAAHAATEVAHDVVDEVARRLKAETDRAAEDAKRQIASEARAALGVTDERGHGEREQDARGVDERGVVVE